MAYGSRAGGRASGTPRTDMGGGGAQAPTGGGPEPMDVSAFGRRGRGRGGARQREAAPMNRNQGRQQGQGQNRGQSQNRGGSARGRGRGQGGQNRGNRGSPAAQGTSCKCYACNKEGHFARECPARVGAIEVEDRIDEYEQYVYEEDYAAVEDDWSPDEHPVACLFQGEGKSTKPIQGKKEEGDVLYHQEPVKIVKKNEGDGISFVNGKRYELTTDRVKKIEKMLANQEMFGNEPEIYKEAVRNQANISFHPQTDESAMVLIGDQMKKIEPTKWKEMRKTFKHYIDGKLQRPKQRKSLLASAHVLKPGVQSYADHVYCKLRARIGDQDNYHYLHALVDTGNQSRDTIMSEELFRKVAPKAEITGTTKSLLGIEERMQVIGRCAEDIHLEFYSTRDRQTVNYKCKPLIVRDCNIDFLLSNADLCKLDVSIRPAAGAMRVPIGPRQKN